MKRNLNIILAIVIILLISFTIIFYFHNKKNVASSKMDSETEERKDLDEETEEKNKEQELETNQEITNTNENQNVNTNKSQENTNSKNYNSSNNTAANNNKVTTSGNQVEEEIIKPNVDKTEQVTSKGENITIITENKIPSETVTNSPTIIDNSSNSNSNNNTTNTPSDKVNSDNNTSNKDNVNNNDNNNNSDKVTPSNSTSDKDSDKDKNDKVDKEDKNDKEETQKNSKTAQEVINEMGAGWNLGNALDSTNYQKEFLNSEKNISYYETLWGNPVTTKSMIDAIKKAGFKSIRVPVTYYDHMSKDGTIDEKWLDRVEEVINYVLKNNMYCILDIHHDTGLYPGGSYIVSDADKFEENAEKLKKMWIQIGTRFKNYDDHLIFEGFNEMVDQNKNYDWNSGYQNTLTVYKLNQVFVDTVRSLGGKNATRFLAVSTFGSITDDQKLSTFTLPKDTVKDKIILALHDYADTTSGIDSMFERIEKYCKSRNIPVILDEYGMFKTNFKTEEERAKMTSYYVSKAKKLKIACYWWDNGKKDEYSIFNRTNLTWEYPKIRDAILKAS